jgi:hypothetical protein
LAYFFGQGGKNPKNSLSRKKDNKKLGKKEKKRERKKVRLNFT